MSVSILNTPVPFDTIPNSTPYPFYSTPNTILEFFSYYLFNNKKRCPIGFMPCKNSHIPEPQATSFEIVITRENDDNQSLSSDDSSDDSIEDIDSEPVSYSSSVLSDILCEHYAQNTSHNTTAPAENSLVKSTLKKLHKEEKSYRAFPPREIRSNTDYLRMIVAEVNMMRSQKIIGPLKQRRVLPKRLDPFIPKRSPLNLQIQ